MKKKLKRFYWSAFFWAFRSDVCPKHWVKKERTVSTTEVIGEGQVRTMRVTRCGVCVDEENERNDRSQLEAEQRERQSEERFWESVEALRKEYL